MTLYDEIIARKIPHTNHYSDLYVPVTSETRTLVKQYKPCVSIFINQVEGGIWYDLAFQYQPYWESKRAENVGT